MDSCGKCWVNLVVYGLSTGRRYEIRQGPVLTEHTHLLMGNRQQKKITIQSNLSGQRTGVLRETPDLARGQQRLLRKTSKLSKACLQTRVQGSAGFRVQGSFPPGEEGRSQVLPLVDPPAPSPRLAEQPHGEGVQPHHRHFPRLWASLPPPQGKPNAGSHQEPEGPFWMAILSASYVPLAPSKGMGGSGSQEISSISPRLQQ